VLLSSQEPSGQSLFPHAMIDVRFATAELHGNDPVRHLVVEYWAMVAPDSRYQILFDAPPQSSGNEQRVVVLLGHPRVLPAVEYLFRVALRAASGTTSSFTEGAVSGLSRCPWSSSACLTRMFLAAVSAAHASRGARPWSWRCAAANARSSGGAFLAELAIWGRPRALFCAAGRGRRCRNWGSECCPLQRVDCIGYGIGQSNHLSRSCE
jgi:hypothetical protein